MKINKHMTVVFGQSCHDSSGILGLFFNPMDKDPPALFLRESALCLLVFTQKYQREYKNLYGRDPEGIKEAGFNEWISGIQVDTQTVENILPYLWPEYGLSTCSKLEYDVHIIEPKEFGDKLAHSIKEKPVIKEFIHRR